MRPAPSSSTSSAWPTSRRCSAANFFVEAGERHQALLNRLPLGERIQQQAAARIGRENHVAVGARQQGLAMLGGNSQAALVVER